MSRNVLLTLAGSQTLKTSVRTGDKLMTETDSMAKRFAIVACAYATYALQRFILLPSVTAYFAVPYVVGLVCAPVAVVAIVPVLWSGPTWAKIIGGLLALPPIYVLITMVRGMFGEVTYFNLMM